jgi:hypothetical protein
MLTELVSLEEFVDVSEGVSDGVALLESDAVLLLVSDEMLPLVSLEISEDVSELVSPGLEVSDGLPQDESKKAPRAKERNILFTCLLVSMFKIIAKA